MFVVFSERVCVSNRRQSRFSLLLAKCTVCMVNADRIIVNDTTMVEN